MGFFPCGVWLLFFLDSSYFDFFQNYMVFGLKPQAFLLNGTLGSVRPLGILYPVIKRSPEVRHNIEAAKEYAK